MSEPRKVVQTAIGPLRLVPDCKAQAVCVNGWKCWEVGRCLCGQAGKRADDE